jgi:Ca-activated chloride channel family protein
MRGRPLPILLLAGLSALWTAPHGDASAQEEEPQPSVLLIMDSSGSMLADDGTGRPKIDAAKEALSSLVDELPEGVLVGLRVYGHRVPNTDKARGCRDTELIVPVGPLERAGMKDRIRSYQARGFTPIGLSLRLGARDLPAEGERTIILVSDGIDTCAPPDPCRVAQGLARQDIELTIETVGFQVDPQARDQLRCIARVTGGSYQDAADAGELAEGLEVLALRALRLFEAQGIPVQGAPVPDGAPIIGPGQYTDSISPGETLWYGVDLATGQSLEASATMVVQGPGAGLGSTAVFEMGVSNPAGQVDVNAREVAFGVGQESQSVAVTGQPVGSGDELYGSPGTYFFTVTLEDAGGQLPESEYSLELVVGVSGQPAGQGGEGDERGEGQGIVADRGPGPAFLVGAVFGLLGVLAGALGVAGIGRRR